MSGTNSALRLIELALVRLCQESEGLADLASDAARSDISRMELCRAAWGPGDQPVPLARLRSLALGVPDRVEVDTSAVAPTAVFPALTGRIVLNLLLLATDSLPSGGRIQLAGTPDDLFVRIAGADAAWPSGMAICLSDEWAARSALLAWRSPQMALTALLAHAAGVRLSVLLATTTRDEPAILRLGG